MLNVSVKDSPKIKKSVSFAETNQFFLIEYVEPIEEETDNQRCSANDEIESMIAYDAEFPSHVSFNGLDRSSAGTALDMTTFQAYPRRLSIESVGPAGFSMDDVIRKLLNIQACSDVLSDELDVTDWTLNDSGDTATDEPSLVLEAADDNNENVSGLPIFEHESDSISIPQVAPSMLNTTLQSSSSSPSSPNSDSSGRRDDVIRGATTILIPDQSVPTSSNLQLIFSVVTSKRNSVETALTAPDTVETAESHKTSKFNRLHVDCRSADSRKYSHDIITTTMTPLSDYQPASAEALRAMNLTKPLPPLQQREIEQISTTQCRRQERMHMYLSVAMEKSTDAERHPRIKLLLKIFFLWVVLPVSSCSLTFGIVPYDYFVNSGKVNSMGQVINRLPGDIHGSRWAITILPWTLIMGSAAILSMEIYSSIIGDIDLTITAREKGLYRYLQISIAAICASMIMQTLIFGATGGGQIRNWLPVMASGFMSIAMVLSNFFIKSKLARIIAKSPISVNATRNFIQCLLGIFVLIFMSSTGYTIFAITYSQYSHSHKGAIGILLAFVFPFLRHLLTVLMQKCPGLQWGSHKGYMCEEITVYLIATMWHMVFGCLIVGVKSTMNQHITLIITESILQGVVLIEIIRMRYLRKRHLELNDAVTVGLRYKVESRNTGSLSKTGSWRSNRSIAVDCFSTHSNEEKRNINECDTLSLSKESSRWLKVTTKNSKSTVALSCSNRDGLSSTRSRSLLSQNFASYSREIQHSTWLAVTWTSGILTPLAFLACSAVFSMGTNQRLFSLDLVSPDDSNANTVNKRTSDWEVSANLNRVWSVKVFGPHHTPSPFVYRLIGMSILHLILLGIGFLLMSCQLSWPRDRPQVHDNIDLEKGQDREVRALDKNVTINMLGAMSALLECHYSIVALSSVMTMSIAFSVVFPWYGMNAAF